MSLPPRTHTADVPLQLQATLEMRAEDEWRERRVRNTIAKMNGLPEHFVNGRALQTLIIVQAAHTNEEALEVVD